VGDWGARARRPVGADRATAPAAEATPLPHPGRRPIDDRAALAGIVFVLKTGITWNQLPTSLVGCSGVTCWRRLGGLAAGILTPLG
jgi:transposase